MVQVERSKVEVGFTSPPSRSTLMLLVFQLAMICVDWLIDCVIVLVWLIIGMCCVPDSIISSSIPLYAAQSVLFCSRFFPLVLVLPGALCVTMV